MLSVEIRKLSSRIVQSPEQLQANVAMQKKKLEEDKQSLAALLQSYKSLQARERFLVELKKVSKVRIHLAFAHC